MKRFGIVVLLLWITAVLSQAQVKIGFNLDGNVQGLKNGSKLCMVIKRRGKIDTMARATAQNGLFKFKNIKLPVYPDFYLVCIQTEFVDNLQLFLDQTSDVKITGELVKWPAVTVTGSKIHDDFTVAKKLQKKVWDGDFAAKNPSRSATPDTLLAYSKKAIQAVVNQIPNSLYIPAMLSTWTYTSGKLIVPSELKKPFYDTLSDAQKNSHYGKILAKQIGIKK